MANVEDVTWDTVGSLTIVIGLPGSGKSTYLKRLKHEDSELVVFDDYQAGAESADPRLSPYYPKLIETLNAGGRVVVADIRFCLTTELNLFLGAVLSAAPQTALELKYFENDPEQCKTNVRNRARKDHVDIEIQKIDDYSAHYRPLDQQTLPVFRTS